MGKFFANLNLVLVSGLAVAILIMVFPDSGYAGSVGAGDPPLVGNCGDRLGKSMFMDRLAPCATSSSPRGNGDTKRSES